MFSGIVSGIGEVSEIRPLAAGSDMRLVISTGWSPLAELELGASVACSGCCLTLVEKDGRHFSVDVSAETLARTTLGQWRVGRRINLERSLRIGDELGGHFVAGHVDGVGTALSAEPEYGSTRWRFRAPEPLARYISVKGSIAIDGVSLTVNEVDGATFGVNIIPHTATVTSFAALAPGMAVNLEIDMLARIVARLLEAR